MPKRVTAVLSGGGEMGALARALDWRQTPLGPVEEWPQSLRTTLSILLESKFPMLLCWGREYLQFYNDPFRPILGASKHPALGKSAKDTFAEAWHIVGPLFDQVMTGDAVGFDDMLVPLDRDGYLEECYFTYSYSPVRIESGEAGGVLVTCSETTARVIAERRLQTLRLLGSQAAQPQDEQTAWLSAAHLMAGNPADLPFTLIYGVDEEGQRGRLLTPAPGALAPAVIDGEDAESAWPIFGLDGQTGCRVVADVRQRFGDHAGAMWPEPVESALVVPVTRPGLAHPYGVLVAGISPRLALDGKYQDFLLLVGDQIAAAIANARAGAEEKRRTDALIELDRQKTNFFSNVSHEFRTPLTLLLGPVEAALEEPQATLDRDALSRIHRNAQRLLRLVNTLLDFSRMEAGRAQARFAPVDIAALTREVAAMFQSLVEQAGLRFDVSCEAVAAPVYVDQTMWEQIVLNLLSNAFKFTFEGRISVRLRGTAGAVELRVQDTGTGIPAAELPYLFDRFRRVEGARSRSHEGSGIGLTLVQELVRMHGGSIEVASVEGAGTTFVVRVPTGTEHLDLEHVAANSPAQRPVVAASPIVQEASRWLDRRDGEPAGPAVGPGSLAGDQTPDAHLLVVDDNADMRDYLRSLLSPFWQVHAVATGREALAAIAAHSFDLVVTDVMMPDSDGFELLRRLRATPATRTVPVLMLSARAGEEARLEGLRAGADDYLVKPFSARELLALVRTQLELSRLRRESASQHERLLTLFAVAPSAMALLRGPTHVYEFANQRYLELIGRSDVIGVAGREALPELVRQSTWDLFDGVYASGEPFTAREFPVQLDRLGNGALDQGYFDFVLQPLKDARNRTEGILAHAIEVTDAVLARQRVEEAREAAEAANRAKDEFLAMLGHELRNPLAPILTALQLMTLRGEVGAQKERAVIERQVRHVVRLVDDLLDVSRITRGRIELRSERVEMAEVVARAVEMAGPLIEERRHDLTVSVPASGLAVDGDPTRLYQVVLNLLTNAAKYTPANGRITLTAERLEDEIVLRVRDTGIGIAPATLPRVFDLFIQERQALDRSSGGLGLGLTIVRSLVQLHGGAVTASSDGVGRGSEFTVRLPVAAGAAEPGVRPVPGETRADAPADGRLRILIVDDNLDAATLLEQALQRLGHETRTAPDGPSALQQALEFHPEVALLDLGLPVMDGYELAEHLRRRGPAVKLVAVTGYGQESDRHRSRASGFDAHIVKPVDLDSLQETIRAVLEPRERGGA